MADPDPDAPDEPASVAAADSARTELVGRLFNEHNEALLRFLAIRLQSHQEAKEVAQEAYVKLLNLDRPEAVSFQRAFLFKTAANLAIDRLRSRNRHQRAKQSGMFDELREAHSPEREAAAAQEIELLEKLVSELPPKCRQAFILYKVHGLEFAEVAARMQLSERMVRDYVVRAILYCRVGIDAASNPETTHG